METNPGTVAQPLGTEGRSAAVASAVHARGDGPTRVFDHGHDVAATETLDQVLGSMSHAVFNALNSIMAASQLAGMQIAQGRVDEGRASLRRVDSECSRAARLLRDGCGLATLRVPDTRDGVDVGELVGGCAQAWFGFGDVQARIESGLPRVRGQATALKRLFAEILQNAFEFGAERVIVSATADLERRAVRIEFRDDGPGLPDRPVPSLFESFTTSDPAEHSGLGLAAAARIVAAYDGAIGVDDASRGAAFWVRLPFARA